MKSTILILISLFISAPFLYSCTHSIEGEGPIVEEELSLRSFTKLSTEGSFKVIITQGDVQSVFAKGQQNIINRIKTDIEDDELEIGLKNGNYKDYDLTIYITSPKLSKIELEGSGGIDINTFLVDNLTLEVDGSGNINAEEITTQNLTLEIDGSGDITIDDLETVNTVLDIDGSGNIDIDGTSTNQTIEIEGSGDISAYGINDNKSTEIKITGSGNCKIRTSENLDVTISGSGDVYYKGNPTVTQKITGSGELKHKN